MTEDGPTGYVCGWCGGPIPCDLDRRNGTWCVPAPSGGEPNSWEGDTAVWSIADAHTSVLLHGASTVGREIELAVDSYDGGVTLTDDQALRIADALRAAATWKRSLADRVPFDVEAGLADIVGTDPEDQP